MTYIELLAAVSAKFNVTLTVCKEKAGYLMLNPNGTLGNWDCGHTCPSLRPYVELPNGWGYALIEGEWYRLRDGMVGHRQGLESAEGAACQDAPSDYSLWD